MRRSLFSHQPFQGKKLKVSSCRNSTAFVGLKISSEALAASTVKVQARDVLATWKILISLGVAPVLYASYACLATYIAIKANMPFTWIAAVPLATMIALPLMSYAALKFGEAGVDILKCVVE